MPVNFNFRKSAVRTLSRQIGVYILADLDNIPMYVGQSTDGIRQRVQRHLTSARSDIIANRQIDVWEIAYVWEYPVESKELLDRLEAALFYAHHPNSSLMNGKIPAIYPSKGPLPEPENIVQVMTPEEIAERLEPEQRLPRQAAHYAQVVGHFLAVKNSVEVKRAMSSHFERLSKYHQKMVGDMGDGD
jgi:hypothetical protein